MLPVSKLGKIIRIPAFVQLRAKTDIYTYRCLHGWVTSDLLFAANSSIDLTTD